MAYHGRRLAMLCGRLPDHSPISGGMQPPQWGAWGLPGLKGRRVGLAQRVRWQVQAGSLCPEHTFQLVPPCPAFGASWRPPRPAAPSAATGRGCCLSPSLGPLALSLASGGPFPLLCCEFLEPGILSYGFLHR